MGTKMLMAKVVQTVGWMVHRLQVEQIITGQCLCIYPPASLLTGACTWFFLCSHQSQYVPTGSLGTAASMLYVMGRSLPPMRGLAAAFALLSAVSHVCLPSLQTRYSLRGYGSYRLHATQPLLSPPSPKRHEIRADQGAWFRDQEGRRVLLRGVNLAGSSKFPLNAATHITDSFYNTSDISFVGRPFPLSEADEHFARLRAWGLTFVRLLVTWEAVEHAGPGEYDEDYLDYLLAIVRKADEFGISCFVDPHQDVWSFPLLPFN